MVGTKKIITLPNGSPIVLREVQPSDEVLEAGMFKHLSSDTQRFRYFSPIKDVKRHLRQHYQELQFNKDIGIVAEMVSHDGNRKIIGISHLFLTSHRNAEFAIVVADPWQNEGLGSVLMDFILEIARDRGIKKIYAYVLPDNVRMLAMMKKRKFAIRTSDDNMIAELVLRS